MKKGKRLGEQCSVRLAVDKEMGLRSCSRLLEVSRQRIFRSEGRGNNQNGTAWDVSDGGR